ncbi:MAG: hypothetical protein ACPLTR_03840 [Thermacetogeniaceae bacterium]
MKREQERRLAEARSETSLPEVLDKLLEELATAMEGVSSLPFSRDAALNTLVAVGRPFPVIALFGFKSKINCDRCRETTETSVWPEILGVKVWDWPFQPVEPLKYSSIEHYVRGFIASYAPIQKIGASFVLHLTAKRWPCRCSREHPRSYSVYQEVVETGETREVSWVTYQKACTAAAQAIPEIAEAQKKNAEFAKRR